MSPLSFVAIGVPSIERSLVFYHDLVGFDVVAEGEAGARAASLLGDRAMPLRTCLLTAAGCPVGRILLVEAGEEAQPIRRLGDRTSRGLWNLNFYVEDIRAVTRALREQGFTVWHDPMEYEVGPQDGRVIEMVFDGPDGVAVNLVQPLGDATTATGRVRIEADRAGRTGTGFTPVATSPTCVYSAERTLAFYQGVLGSEVLIDAVLGKDATNAFLCRPQGSRSHTIFIGGGHPFGKVAINQPLNYAVPERAADTLPGNIGIFAQGFVVPDLARAERQADALGGTRLGHGGAMDLPGFAGERAALFRTPDEGAPVWLVAGA